ncbi:hypothetical protein [Neorhizobium vignae]|uniref:hypothetical protein n=1 Tax=Neorhizobium vignae TaxID=690585 RepID=UPI001FCA63F4|nr:hypothetical protein [Neorhizobium vignae]
MDADDLILLEHGCRIAKIEQRPLASPGKHGLLPRVPAEIAGGDQRKSGKTRVRRADGSDYRQALFITEGAVESLDDIHRIALNAGRTLRQEPSVDGAVLD